MRQTLCDLCGNVVREEDVRYIDITKLAKDKDGETTSKPTKPALEVCVICAEDAYKRIMA